MAKYAVGDQVRATYPDDAVSGNLWQAQVIGTGTQKIAGEDVETVTVRLADGKTLQLPADGVQPTGAS
jgi:hypothetical protein